MAAQQFAVDGFELLHDAVEPIAPARWFIAHQAQIEGTESNAAQRPNQISVALQQLSVALNPAPPLAPEFDRQLIGGFFSHPGFEPAAGLPALDQIAILAAAVGAQAGQQLNSFQQVGLALAVIAEHQQPRRIQLQMQLRIVAKTAQLQAVEKDGGRATQQLT